MADVKVTKDLEAKTLTIEYVLDAPKEKVWRAYSNKDWFERWWGPEGWETTTLEFDFTPGGRIHYCMKCVDESQGEWYGQESWGVTIIEKIDAPDSYSARDYFSDAKGNIKSDMPGQNMSVELVEEDGKTHMISRSITETAEQLEELVKMGMVEGFSSQLKRLDQLLVSQG